MQWKSINKIVMLLFTAIFMFATSGCNQSTSNQSSINDFNKSIDDKLEAIVSNPEHASSSNPYDYTKVNKDYEYIVKQGDKALKYMLSDFEKSNENGLKEYVMAIACSEILGEKPEQKNWSSGREWYEGYLKS